VKLLVLVLACLLSQTIAAAAEVERVKGEGTLVRGLVKAALKEGAGLLDGDEVHVGAASEVLVRISDKVAFLLRSGSSMTVSSASDELGIALRLISGALRYASGKGLAGKFRTSTPHASMGVRGTDFDVLVLNDAQPGGLAAGTYVTVRHGAVDVMDLVTGATAAVTQDESVYAHVPAQGRDPTVAQAEPPVRGEQRRQAGSSRALTRPPARLAGTGLVARQEVSAALWRIDLLPAPRGEFDELLDGLR
jgi:hypothetical protein